MTEAPLTLAQVAKRFGKSRIWMYRHMRDLAANHGFPPPIPGFGRVWDPRAIEAWLEAQRAPKPPIAAAPDAAAVAPELDWAEILDQRAAALAAPMGSA